ncbi:36626_t:CDS:2, partial [Gigaspora margarita]
FETKEWLYEEFGWENDDSISFNKVDEQNNKNSTLEQSTESLVCEEVKTFIPNSEYENCSNDSQQTVIEEDNSLYKEFGWENGNSTSFNKVNEQNNKDPTLEQSTESLVHEKVKTSTPNSEYENCSNDSQQTILIRLRLSTNDFVYELDPLKINFTQTTISSWFRDYDGYNIEKTTKDLVYSKLNPKNLPIIRVCIINEKFVSADNRRLYCLKKAIKNGAKFNKVSVKKTDEKARF